MAYDEPVDNDAVLPPEITPEGRDILAEADRLEKEAEAEERIAKARARIEAAQRAKTVPVDAQRGSRDAQPREPDIDRQLGDTASAFAPGVQRLLREQAVQGKYKIDFANMKVR